MRVFIIGIFTVACLQAAAQGGNNLFKLPEVLPPSPDVAAITKGAELSATPHTGGAIASIPVYELKVPGFSLPISINYSSNGYKPAEIPSRVGLNWNLNAGGVVSRIVRGKPDDFAAPPANYLTEAQIMQMDATSYGFLTNLEDQASNVDAQPDEYRYSINGLSGKFIIQRNGTILQMPYNNVKISVAKNQGAVTDIYITDGNGIKYTFGEGMTEVTVEHNLVHNMLQKQNIVTAWMLTKITLPNSHYLTFNYASVTHYVKTGVQESVRKGIPGEYCSPEPPAQNIPCPVDAVASSKTALIRYNSKYLTSINANTGQWVGISYADRPDAGGDNRVDYIIVYNSQSVPIKKIQLEYLDRHSPNNTPHNEGYFLKKVNIKDPTNNSSEQQVFELGYVDEATAGAGATHIMGIDHLGFANGANNSTLLPVVSTYVFYGFPLFQGIGTANRNPNGNYSKKGMLEKVIYPTGGYDQFDYEPNMKTWWDSVEVKNIVNARASGVGGTNPFQFYNTYFTVGKNQLAELHLKVDWLGSPPIPDGDPAPKTAFARVYNTVTNEMIKMRRAEGFAGGAHYLITDSINFQLPAGQYRLELEVRYSNETLAQADVVYDNANSKIWKQQNEELCGVRVRKVVSYDPLTKKSVSKFYTYKSLQDTLLISANRLYNPQYVMPYQNGLYCGRDEVVCNGYILTSNSATALYANEAAGVTYTSVIESDDSTFANGCIQHDYLTQGEFVGLTLMGNNIPDPPADMYNYMNGVEGQTLYYNKDKAIVRKTNNYYSIDSRVNLSQFSNYIVRKRYDKVLVGPAWDERDFEHLDVITYPIATRWDHLDSTVTVDYDLVNNASVKTKTVYTYGNVNNVQPTITKSWGSDKAEQRKEVKYPNDLSGANTVFNSMVARNMVNTAVEEKLYKDNKLLYTTNTDYKDWFNNTYILMPEIIRNQKNGSNAENRIHYYQYDEKGNPLELAKENDVRITYIWDYGGQYPIAEITNASWGSGVAYTSFETNVKGGWSFSGTPVMEGTETAGKKSYLLSNGSINYSGSMTVGKKYYISYWSKGNSVNVNGSSGTIMLSRNGWTLYRHAITYSSGNITVAGSGYIDELRLYPDGAFMKTFTYKPEVGITSTADNNSAYQWYEYDVFNRLLRIRDMDNNILKQYEYKYGQTVTPCPNTAADWQATGNYRCAKNSNNNNTGIKEREERDLNNCSETYQQLRWVSMGTSPECPVVPNCTGPDKRVINGICETGCKTLVASEYLGNLLWQCTFRYYWQQDGYWGPSFTENSNNYCLPIVCGE